MIDWCWVIRLLFANYVAAPSRFKARDRRANGRAAEVITLKVGIFQYSRALSLTRLPLSFAMNESDRNVRGAVCSANLAGDDSRLIRVQVNACTQNKWLFGEALCYYICTFLLADATHGVFFYSFANFNANAFGTKEGTLLKALAEAVSLRQFYSHFSIDRLCNKCSCIHTQCWYLLENSFLYILFDC
jgi:hypothetical protein